MAQIIRIMMRTGGAMLIGGLRAGCIGIRSVWPDPTTLLM